MTHEEYRKRKDEITTLALRLAKFDFDFKDIPQAIDQLCLDVLGEDDKTFELSIGGHAKQVFRNSLRKEQRQIITGGQDER